MFVKIAESEPDEVRVVRLRRWICHLFSLLRIHSPDCRHCNPGRESRGNDMRKRLEELNDADRRPVSLKSSDAKVQPAKLDTCGDSAQSAM